MKGMIMKYILEGHKIERIEFDSIENLNQYLYENYHPDSYELIEVTTYGDKVNKIGRYII